MEINIHEKELCVKLVIYKDYTEMHGQQNIKYPLLFEKQIPVSYMSVQWEPACFMWTDGQTDITKLPVAFRNFFERTGTGWAG